MRRLPWQLKSLWLSGMIPLDGLTTHWGNVAVMMYPHKTSITVEVTTGVYRTASLVDHWVGLPNNWRELVELKRRLGSVLTSENVRKWAKLHMLGFISRTVRDALSQPTTGSNEDVHYSMKLHTLIPEVGVEGKLTVKDLGYGFEFEPLFTSPQLLVAWFLARLGYELVEMVPPARSRGADNQWRCGTPLSTFRNVGALGSRLGVASTVLEGKMYVPFLKLTKPVVQGLQTLELIDQRGRR
ncbi:hypothetical protein DRO59_03395 [Candidatus Bathyarchaeota archaeon]|nr:MAG: hypothetical protein DRO59_03395 [Candidatus Bathyarchaeota archaeon]